MNSPISKTKCEFIRELAKQRFYRAQGSWIECGKWAAPHRIKWMLSRGMGEGARNNAHIVDATHILALRSYVAGFLEGNTSASRPWYRFGVSNQEVGERPEVHQWLERFTNRTLQVLGGGNFYDAAGQFYYDFGVFNTGAHYIEERDRGLHFHTLIPGSYYVLNNGYNEPSVLIREFSLTVEAIVKTYAKKNKSGRIIWDNISPMVKKMYNDGNLTQQFVIIHMMCENPVFDPNEPQVLLNKKWLSLTYEIGDSTGTAGVFGEEYGPIEEYFANDRYLQITASRRKPFIVGKSDSGNNFEYGEKGPTLDALGLIKSLNKKAIAKDQALEQILAPALQGPANLRKSYISQTAKTYVPLDPTSLAQKGLRPIFDVNPILQPLVQDVDDLRSQVGKLYYEDFLLYLTQNPKTRTAAETNAVVQEQQLVIGPALQSLNWTYNVPVVEFIADYVMFDDPVMQNYPMPEILGGLTLKPEFISVFAQAQKAADLPGIERYLRMVTEVGTINPAIFDKANVDKIADIYEDRLFLPFGLNNPQDKVDAMRQQAQAEARRQQMLQETIPAMAGAARDMAQTQGMNPNGGKSA